MSTASVSVIVPAYRSDGTIATCLDGLREQTCRDFELVVVNSSPGDQTAELVRAAFPDALIEESPDRLLPHAARNRGARLAGGDLLVFTDPDCRPRPDWLERLVTAHESAHELVAGAMGLQGHDTRETGVHLCKFFWALPGGRPGLTWIAPTANAAYARALWDRIGPFPEDGFSGDGVLSWRAAAVGSPPWFEPRAVVEHVHGSTARELWRERLLRGEEFGRVRPSYERWSRRRLAAHLAVSPVLPFVVLARAAREARQSGWTRRYISTIPLQLTGHLAWSLGETRGWLRLIRNGAQP